MHPTKRNTAPIQFTIKKIDALPPAEPGKRATYYDQTIPALSIVVTDKGSKAWYVRKDIGGQSKRIKLGNAIELAPDDARRKAVDLLRDIARGVDPTAATSVGKITLAEVLADYLQARSVAASTAADYRRAIGETFAAIENKPLARITRDTVRDLYLAHADKSKARANNAARVLRALWNYARATYRSPNGDPALPENPVLILSDAQLWRAVQRKQTHIDAAQLPRFWQACETLKGDPRESVATSGALFQVLLLTGLRLSEAQRIGVDTYTPETKTIRLAAGTTKNKREHLIPLSKQAAEIVASMQSRFGRDRAFECVGSVYVWTKAAGTIAGLDFSPHDLRRSFLTFANDLGLSGLTIKRLANHASADLDVTAGYIMRNIDDLRKATQQITDRIFSLVSAGSRPNDQ